MIKSLRFYLIGLLTLTGLWAQTDYTFSDGGRKVQYRMAQDEVFSAKPANSGKEWAGGALMHLAKGQSTRKFAKSAAGESRKNVAPVFYNTGDLPTAARLAAMPAAERERLLASARRPMTPKLLVHMDDTRFVELADTKPAASEASLLKGWMLVVYADAFAALDAADWMTRQGGWEFTPVFARESYVRAATLTRPVNDPLYPSQWHLQDSAPFNLGMRDAWDRATGKGINIVVIDDALEIKHEDFTNAYPLESGYHRNFKSDGAPNDPSPMSAKENHGTYCGGLAAAAGFNNVGVTGVAPESRAIGMRYVGGAVADDASSIALAWQPGSIISHVSTNSWGPADDGMSDGRVGALQLSGMEKGTTTNRNGLGTVFVISGGNGRVEGDDESYDEFSSSRFGIAVAALGNDGKQSSYSENGVGIAIAAFGGEQDPPNVLWSTNVSGDEAFQIKAAAYPTTMAPVNYTDAGNGTSAAAPQVSGAAALLLELNPKLGYRDVKEILMKSALRDGLQGADGFLVNAGGFYFSHSMGAGLLNVASALDLATGWTPLGPLVTANASGAGGDIADSGAPTTVSFDLSSAAIRVEHVEVTVNVKHANRGDLSFTITSPSGYVTTAAGRPKDAGADFVDYLFTTPHFWGESAAGKWTVSVTDTVANGVAGSLTGVKLKVYGTAK